MKRVAIYINCLFEGKYANKHIEEMKTFALNKKDWIIKDIFVDTNTIKDNEKKEFNKFYENMEKNEYDILLVEKLTDLASKTLLYLAMEETIYDYGVTIYLKDLDCEIKLGEIIDNRIPDSLLEILTKKRTKEENQNNRLSEMKFSLQTLHLMRCTLSDNIVQEENNEHLLEAYDFINQAESKIWKYIEGETKNEES